MSDEESTPVPPPIPAVALVEESAPPLELNQRDFVAIVLVAFDHAEGPLIEYAHGIEQQDEELLNSDLAFLALPDGSHTKAEDYSYFHLLLPKLSSTTVFGISCNRQIGADQLLNKPDSVTRSTVQKAIVVLTSRPIFGPLRDKLGLITRAFFAQKDFADKTILVDLYESLRLGAQASPLSSGEEERGENEESGMYMGTSLRELVYKFRFKTLMLLKLLLLQRKVMFYAASSPVESLCTFQYSLVALIPALLTHLEDCASPSLDTRSHAITRPTSLKTSDKNSLIRYLGLPLNIFGEGSFFQPYLPLQQIDVLKTRSFLVGTTNAIFQQQRDCPIDVVVNIDTATLNINDPKLVSLLALTSADRKWMDEIVTTVDASWNASDPTRPVGLNFIGSEDFLRAKFEEYICSMLSCIKFTSFLAKSERGEVLLSASDGESNMMTAFNESFVNAFRETPAFKLWDRTTDDVIFDLVEPKHPMEGKTSPLEDVGIRLAHGLHDLHLEENLAPTREAISRGIMSGSDSLWKTFSSVKEDLAKRQRDFTEQRSKDRLTAESSRDGTRARAGEEGGIVNGLTPVIAVTANNVLAGMDSAKIQATAMAAGFGSFLSSRRTQLFPLVNTKEATSRPSSTSSTSSTPANSFSSFFRPLSTASMASTASTDSTTHLNPSLIPSQTPSTPAWGFPSFRRSVSTESTRSLSSQSISLNQYHPKPPSLKSNYSDFSGNGGNNNLNDIDTEGLGSIRDLDAEYGSRLASEAQDRGLEERMRAPIEVEVVESEVEEPDLFEIAREDVESVKEVEKEREEEGHEGESEGMRDVEF